MRLSSLVKGVRVGACRQTPAAPPRLGTAPEPHLEAGLATEEERAGGRLLDLAWTKPGGSSGLRAGGAGRT